jgi:hypothetical protein
MSKIIFIFTIMYITYMSVFTIIPYECQNNRAKCSREINLNDMCICLWIPKIEIFLLPPPTNTAHLLCANGRKTVFRRRNDYDRRHCGWVQELGHEFLSIASRLILEQLIIFINHYFCTLKIFTHKFCTKYSSMSDDFMKFKIGTCVKISIQNSIWHWTWKTAHISRKRIRINTIIKTFPNSQFGCGKQKINRKLFSTKLSHKQ